MKSWTYAVFSHGVTVDEWRSWSHEEMVGKRLAWLNDLGIEGWELVELLVRIHSQDCEGLFKRAGALRTP